MSGDNGSELSLFKFTEVGLPCYGSISLSAWCKNGRTQILALFSRNGNFYFCFLTGTSWMVKKVRWYEDSVHTPSAIAFSPSGSFLLVVSTSCHLYAMPALLLFDPNFKNDVPLEVNDITIFPYPFNGASRCYGISRKSSFGSTSSAESNSDTFTKLKDMSGKSTDVAGTSVAWYLGFQYPQHIAVIGTNTGEIIMVDLINGLKLREMTVHGQVKNISVCVDVSMESVFLLVTNSNRQQFRIILEQKPGRGKGRSRGSSPSDDTEDEAPRREHRGRLQGLKQLSVDTLAGIMNKIAETRAKAHLRTGAEEIIVRPLTPLEPVEVTMRDTNFVVQHARSHNFLVGLHSPTQLLTVHPMSVEGSPLFVHKLPQVTHDCLLGEKVLFVVTMDKCHICVVSLNLSKSSIESDADFNTESVLGTYDIVPLEASNSSIDSDVLDPETILAVYKGSLHAPKLDIPDKWKVESLLKILEDWNEFEACIVVTTRRVLMLHLSTHIMSAILNLILDKHALLQTERLCKIFKINLSSVLEVAGDIELIRLKFAAAIALFKLATCEPLKITGKLARLGHCWELLSYCSALMAAPTANLNMKAPAHISNLLSLSFMHEILQGRGPNVKRKFLLFLEENNYYDKMLAISLAAQSLLYDIVHKLVCHKGLIVEGFTVIIKNIRDFIQNETLFEAAKCEDMWLCVTEPKLQEAFLCRKELFPIFSHFISVHLSQMSVPLLDRLCRLLDPLSPCLRNVARLSSSVDQDNRESFPMEQLVQLFLVVLLVKLSKEYETNRYEKNLMLPDPGENARSDTRLRSHSESDSIDSADEPIWAIRKDRKSNTFDRDQCKPRVLSCGFGHTAMIRNGAVITWGLSSKGNLGNGPTQGTHASPVPLSWFGTFKVQVSQVSCGRNHTAVLTNNGVYTWGSSHYGQLGLVDVHESPYPRLVVPLVTHRVISVVCGQYHTMVLTSSGSVYSFGWNVHGQLGLGHIETTRTPTLVHTLKEYVIVDMACGHAHSVVLTDTGHLYSFGSGVFGQLGTGITTKSATPILIKGITGRVCQLSSSYFHNLALTTGNSLFVWGSSPQTLRMQAHAHKNSRAAQHSEGDPQEFSSSSDGHLTPSLVDTSNVTGKIMQIACGCDHSALVTECGDIYTWGRSMDGQLGNGSRTEVILPSLLDRSFRVSAVALGCDFSVAIDKAGSKVFAWGSNGSGQVGLPIKDVPAKASDGKLILVKTEKRVVRLPNSLANLVDTPSEVPDIPSSTFTYQPLNSSSSEPGSLPPDAYTSTIWHRTLQIFLSIINPELLLCKCLELGHHQAASKLLFLQGQIRQSLVHQLKALQQSQKQKKWERKEKVDDNKKTVQTPKEEIQLFAVQGGVEGMCDMTEAPLNGVDDVLNINAEDIILQEYISTALEILLRYLLHASDNTSDILETGIQFWSAQSLPFSKLEEFLIEHLERVFYPLGCLMYLSKRDLSRHFSSKFQLIVTSRLVNHVESNGDCSEFLAILSKLLSLDGETTVADISKKLQNPPQKAIQIKWPNVSGEAIYIFSCGHTRTKISLPAKQEKLAEAYSKLDTEGVIDMACPDCVCSLLPTEVA